jgi:hypothetical protein
MIKEFFFYLDAWKFCIENSLPIESIGRKDWKTWKVNYSDDSLIVEKQDV